MEEREKGRKEWGLLKSGENGLLFAFAFALLDRASSPPITFPIRLDIVLLHALGAYSVNWL